MKSLSFGIILPVVLPFVCARVIPEQQAISSWSIEKDQPAPGIGVHFTTSYANAAISYDNGTVQDIVRVRADADYIELMGRLANPSNHMKACSGLARRLLRQGRKLFGLPPTGDVAVLSSFVRKVKYSIEEELRSTVSQIMPAFPVLIGLEEEDFHDVMRLAGLTWFQASETDAQPYFHETTAAYAGLGYGLCESWKSPSDCSLEEQKMSYEHILFLNFDNSSFSASVQYMQSARSSWVYSNAVDPHLGWWDLPVYEVPRARFWSRIHEVVLDIAGALQHAPNKIILLGEHSADEEFLDVVKTALWEVLEYDATMLLEAEWEDVGLLGARGAAELARRAQFWIEAPQEDGIEL